MSRPPDQIWIENPQFRVVAGTDVSQPDHRFLENAALEVDVAPPLGQTAQQPPGAAPPDLANTCGL